MDDPSQIDWTRLDRYVTGKGTPEELEALERWVNADPELQALAETMRTLRPPAGVAREAWDARAAWQGLSRRLRGVRRPPLRLAEPGMPWARRRRSTAWRAVAAAAAVVLAAGGAWLVGGIQPGAVSPSAAPMREVVTKPGERAQLYLSDGSRVILGVGSRLRFASPLTSKSRDVYLDGEALFEVKHDDRWPFVVHTPYGTTEDLGTRFNMRAYATDSALTVVVAEGAVAMRTGDTRVVLAPRDLGRLSADGRVTTERGVAVDRYLAWTEGRLVFTGTPLAEALPQLGRWYGLDVSVADSAIAAHRLTATFVAETADEALRHIALALDVRYERAGKTVTFSPKSRTP